MILRETFLKHPFDETITHYGHEDTLFGLVLKKEGIKILHIDNPLMNCGLDTNLDVLLKTEVPLPPVPSDDTAKLVGKAP